MRAGLTQSQWKLLAFVHQFIAEHGYSPSVAEMAIGIGYSSKGSTHNLVRELVARGHVHRLPNRKRTIVLTDDGRRQVETFLARSVSRETASAA